MRCHICKWWDPDKRVSNKAWPGKELNSVQERSHPASTKVEDLNLKDL